MIEDVVRQITWKEEDHSMIKEKDIAISRVDTIRAQQIEHVDLLDYQNDEGTKKRSYKRDTERRNDVSIEKQNSARSIML